LTKNIKRQPFNRTSQNLGLDTAQEAMEQADTTVLQRVDSASLRPRPASVTETWKEREFDERQLEQIPQWEASGTLEARESQVAADGLRPQADAAVYLREQHQPLFELTQQQFADVIRVLGPFRVRGANTKLFYLLRTVAFLIGDIAGISGAAISLGEIVANAYILAISAATATVVAGLIGKELKLLRETRRRARDRNDLSDAEKPYAHLFNDADNGTTIVRAMIFVSLTITILVAGGIFALRASVEGALSGLVFGAFAGAIALGSAISSYSYADEVADLLDNAEANYNRELKRLQALAASEPLRTHLENGTTAQSIQEEHAKRGAAAATAIAALKWRVLAHNPGTVGHGPAASPETVVGRRTREAGDAK
jgi:hypothetical protein